MSNNKMIGTCKLCDQEYCCECSTNGNWQEFCSDNCEKEFEEQEKED